MWDILYEQVPGSSDTPDRVWLALGSPILATRAGVNVFRTSAYGSPTAVYQNPYAMFGFIGGVNVNMGAFDLLIETQNQATRGVSLKRSHRKTQAPKLSEEEIAAAKAAQAEGGK
jgi:hypothetical protein